MRDNDRFTGTNIGWENELNDGTLSQQLEIFEGRASFELLSSFDLHSNENKSASIVETRFAHVTDAEF